MSANIPIIARPFVSEKAAKTLYVTMKEKLRKRG